MQERKRREERKKGRDGRRRKKEKKVERWGERIKRESKMNIRRSVDSNKPFWRFCKRKIKN